MNQNLALAAIFVAVLIVTFTIFNTVLQRREVARNIRSARRRGQRADSDEIDKMLGSDNHQLRYYLDVVKNEHKDSTRMRLVQAGHFDRSAIRTFNLIRISVALAFFLFAQFLLQAFAPGLSNAGLILFSLIACGLGFMLCNIILEQRGKKRMREYRKLFPDLMDLLLVCVDAGLSIEAALDRVTREFVQTVPDFGIQLAIVTLEVRAGRGLDEALANFSDRIRVEEARTLAVLFRQSKELGSDVSKTLRSFSKEMRQLRIVRAEEKANSLPVKMLFPMALFMFPVSLVIVLVPIMLIIFKVMTQMSPT